MAKKDCWICTKLLPTDFMGVYSIISAAINATKLPLVMRPLTIRKLPKTYHQRHPDGHNNVHDGGKASWCL